MPTAATSGLPAISPGWTAIPATIGFNGGIQKELGQRLRGRIGIGLFRSNPDSSSVEAFTGFGGNGELVWNPRVRTAVSLRLSRGDVATVRSGATGRIDTTARVSVDQEVRHNLLLHVSVGYNDRSYRGSARGNFKTFSAETEVEYLLNRRLALYAGATYADRRAPSFADRFKRTTVRAGIRIKL